MTGRGAATGRSPGNHMPFVRSQLIVVLVAVLVALLPALPVGAAGTVGDGLSPVHRAGLVIQHGDGALTYAVVAFAEPTISGIDLLRRSGIAYLSVPFGGLGEGVCQIEREGCEVSDCRRTLCQATRSSPYWQFFEQGPDHSWRPAPLGASGSKVADGEVLAWSWAAGTPALPSLDLAGLADAAGFNPVRIADPGQNGGAVAVVRSGVSEVGGAVDVMALAGGVAAIVVVAGAGSGLLLVRRRRIVQL